MIVRRNGCLDLRTVCPGCLQFAQRRFNFN
jgi:hypothetical protein